MHLVCTLLINIYCKNKSLETLEQVMFLIGGGGGGGGGIAVCPNS